MGWKRSSINSFCVLQVIFSSWSKTSESSLSWRLTNGLWACWTCYATASVWRKSEAAVSRALSCSKTHETPASPSHRFEWSRSALNYAFAIEWTSVSILLQIIAWLIASKIKSFCLHNICMCTVYIYYVHINTHLHVYNAVKCCLYM